MKQQKNRWVVLQNTNFLYSIQNGKVLKTFTQLPAIIVCLSDGIIR